MKPLSMINEFIMFLLSSKLTSGLITMRMNSQSYKWCPQIIHCTASQFCCVCCKRCLSCDGAKWWTMIPALHRLGASGHVFLQPLDTGQLDRNHNAGIVHQSSIILGIIHCGDDTDPGKHHHTGLCTNHPLSICKQTLIVSTPCSRGQ